MSSSPKRKRAPTSPTVADDESSSTALYPSVSDPVPTSTVIPKAENLSPQKVRKTVNDNGDSTPLGSGAELAATMADPTRVGKLPANLVPPPTDRPIRIYSDGIWDLFHFGHAKALEQAKKIFPNVELLVGVCNDELTHAKKGKTVMTDIERYESLRHCKWVDEVIPDAPWVLDQAFLDLHRIDYVAHDDIPYVSAGHDDVYAFVKQAGRFLPTARTEGVSTSDLITRIVRNYDAYVRRNLERGVSPKDLNISFFKEREIRLKSRIANVKQQLQTRIQKGESDIRQNWVDTKNDLPPAVKSTLDYWDEISTDLVKGFTNLFGQEGIPRMLFRGRNGSRDNSPSGSPLSENPPSRKWLFGSRSNSPQDGSAIQDEAEEEEDDDEPTSPVAENGNGSSRGRSATRRIPADESADVEEWDKDE
ncbi:phosphate cytidylyltransferase 1, choline, beta, isoform CRA_c [Powellomyces hirtus]|nr:phosphate cytidylyltransferase 1, choline, beta, isoform CRA_c [Powellomyces hirtus]